MPLTLVFIIYYDTNMYVECDVTLTQSNIAYTFQHENVH